MEIRKATIKDINTITRLRLEYISLEKGQLSDEEKESISGKLKEYLEKWMPLGGFIAFFAEENGEVQSAAFLSIVERPPREAFSSYTVGTVYNVFTYAEHRRKGLATKVVSALLEEARLLDIGYIDLFATKAGKPLYEKLGFILPEYTAMRKRL